MVYIGNPVMNVTVIDPHNQDLVAERTTYSCVNNGLSVIVRRHVGDKSIHMLHRSLVSLEKVFRWAMPVSTAFNEVQRPAVT